MRLGEILICRNEQGFLSKIFNNKGLFFFQIFFLALIFLILTPFCSCENYWGSYNLKECIVVFILFPLFFFSFLIFRFFLNWKWKWSPMMTIPVFFMLLGAIISFSPQTNLKQSFFGLILLLAYFATFFFTINLFTHKDGPLVAWVLILDGFIISLYAIWQAIKGVNIFQINNQINSFFSSGQVFAQFTSPEIMAALLLMVIPLSVTLSLEEKGTFKSLFAALTLALMSTAILFSRSQTGIVLMLLFLGFMVLYWLERKPYYLKKGLILLGLTFALVAFLFLATGFFQGSIENPALFFKKDWKTKEESIASKLPLWKISFKVIADFPLTGSGIGTFSQVYSLYQKGKPSSESAFNSFFQIGAEYGIFSLLGLAFICVFIFREFRKVWDRDSSLYFSFVLSLIVFWVHNSFDYSWYVPSTGILFWLLLGLSIVFKNQIEEKGCTISF